MDVRCDKCSTVYDFDEARIPVAGLPVKCSSCATVFRVYRSAAKAGGGEWMLKQLSGNVIRFKEMTTLQRWIVERKVTPNDEISKNGTNWRRLGDIPELAPFFVAVDQPAIPPTPLVPSPIGGPQLGASPRWEGTPQTLGHAPQQTGNWQMGVPQVATGPVGPTQMRGGGTGPHAAFDADDTDVTRGKKSGGAMKWVLMLVLLVAAAGGGVYALRPDLVQKYLGPKVNELALSHVQTGYIELQKDTYAAIDRAKDNFEKAQAIAPTYADAKAGLAQAELSRAEYLGEEAAELAKRGAGAAEVDAKKRQAKELAEHAFTLAKEALTTDAESAAGSRALADYYRYVKSGDPKPLVDKARQKSPGDPWVSYVQGSSVADDPTLAERAIRYFDEALEAQPKMHRARYKLARVFWTQGNTQKATLHAEMVLKDQPDHERAKALMLEIKPPPAPAAAPEPMAQKPLTFDQLLDRAQRLRDQDQAERAMSLYEKAIDMEPNDPDAHTGMGWCYVDMEEPDAAVGSFKQALAAAPRFTDAHMGLAEAYRMKGMKRDAVKHYRAYLDILPDGPDAPVAKRMVEQLSQ
jgi:predicted Zn finger-like uncharacterized protein